MQISGEGITHEQEVFGKPIFQTFGMFVGMLFALVMHWVVLIFNIPFPGYVHHDGGDDNNNALMDAANGKNYGAIAKEGDRHGDGDDPDGGSDVQGELQGMRDGRRSRSIDQKDPIP